MRRKLVKIPHVRISNKTKKKIKPHRRNNIVSSAYDDRAFNAKYNLVTRRKCMSSLVKEYDSRDTVNDSDTNDDGSPFPI